MHDDLGFWQAQEKNLGEGLTTPHTLADFARAQRKERAESAALDTAGNELLRRAALVRWFDEEIYSAALAVDVAGAPPFAAFITRAEVDFASSRDSTYAIRESFREEQLNRWRKDPSALQSFSSRLVQFYENRKSPVDVFAHLIFADPAKALTEFQRLYVEADRSFDLAQCDTLLRVLRNRGDQRGLELTNALNNREQYFRSRSLFADDWLRTAHFLARPAVTQRFEAFFRDGTKWIFRLYAAGGAGKTAYLRWLIARYCVPELSYGSTRIPVARVDLDFVHLPAVAVAPWLLLLPLAEQLNLQLPYAPFFSLLGSWSTWLPALKRPVNRERATPLPAFDQSREQEMISAFTSSLGYEKAVVVLDTLEEAVLHHPESVATLLAGLSRIRANCPGLKLVLSGRYDPFLRVGLGARVRSLKPFSEVLKLPPWDRAECWNYLTGIRKLRAAMPFDSFVRPARGNPFKVALFADLVDPQRAFTKAELRELRRVEVEYLVERVIERIPESDCPLRWLLRYVVTPRQLTEEFVEQVLAPHLQRAMTASGPEAPDRPGENLPKGAELLRKRRPWAACAMPFSTSVEWAALLRYAGPSSWITISDGLPRPQPELLSPMRYLLQEQPIFADIHRDAAAYFERLAKIEGKDWTEMMCEAIYHQFQCLGSDAGEYWKNWLRQRQAQDVAARRKLAECLLSADFLDDRNQPLPHRKTGTILSPKTLAEALLELAALDVRESFYATEAKGEGGLLKRSAKRLAAVRALEKKHGFQIDFNGRRTLVEVAVDAQSDLAGALRMLDTALAGTIEDAYRPVLLVQRGNQLLKRGDTAGAEQNFLQAAARARVQAEPLIPLWRLEAVIGQSAFSRDDLETAAQHYQAALAAANRSKISEENMGRLVATLTEIDRSSANWSRAAERLKEVEDATGLSFPGLRSQLFLDQNAPAEALRFMLESKKPDHRIEGLAAALNGQLTLAANLLERAWKSSSARDPSVAAQVRFEQISLLVHEVRDYRTAQTLLSHLRDLGDYQINGALLLLELQVRTEKREAAAEGWKRLRLSSKGLGHRIWARVLATGLALELAPRAEFEEMLDVLAAVRPESARLPMLKPFLSFQGKPPLAVAARRFDEILSVPAEAPDFVSRTLLLAEALRYWGDRDRAAAMLEDALRFVGENGILGRKVISALVRLGTVTGEQQILDYGRGLLKVESELAILARVEVAEYFIERSRFDLAAIMLTKPPHEESQFAMRYFFARASVVQAAGETEEAYRFRGKAIETAHRLGIPMRVTPQAPKHAPDLPDLFDPEHGLELSFAEPRRLKVRFQPASVPAIDGELVLGALQAPGKSSMSDPMALYSERQSYPQVAAQLAELLKHMLDQGDIFANGLDLRLELGEDDELAAIPWEWALREPFRHVYRSLKARDITQERLQWFVTRLGKLGAAPAPVNAQEIESVERQLGVFADGWRGVETRRNLNAERNEGVVAIVKLSTEEEREQKIGSGTFSISMEDLYTSRGIRFEIWDPRRLTPEAIQSAFQSVQLLHICLPLTELNGLLQLGSADSTAGSGLSASFLYVLNPERPRPLVLLDPPMPARREFQAQQLVWRNVFARQLFERYSVEAVIAAGLAEDTATYYRGVLANIAGRSSAGELVRYLNINHPESSAALYAFDPAIPMF